MTLVKMQLIEKKPPIKGLFKKLLIALGSDILIVAIFIMCFRPTQDESAIERSCSRRVPGAADLVENAPSLTLEVGKRRQGIGLKVEGWAPQLSEIGRSAASFYAE